MFWEFVAWTFFAVLLPAYYFRKHFGKELTYEHGVAQASMGPIRRNLLTKRNGLVTSPHPNVKTLYDILLHGVKRFHPSRFLFGSRSIERTVTEEKEITDRNGVKTTKSWSFSQLGAYNWMTYNDVFQAISQIGSGLVHLGLRPNDKVTIFASTGRDWMLMAHSCFSQSITITTAYDTLGVDGLAFSINQGEVTTLFTQANLFAVIREIGAKAPSLKTLIYTGKFDEIELLELTKLYPKIQFFSIEQLRQLGIAHEAPTCPPAPEDIACIMYTSGSTGNPKGVMLTHANIVAAVAGLNSSLDNTLREDDVYLAYLPLAHILEFVCEHFMMFKGIRLGFGSPRSLSDASVRNCNGDLRELRPTIMAAVPTIWETLRKGILAKVQKSSPFQQKVFRAAIELKQLFPLFKPLHDLLDEKVFKAVKDVAGGRLRYALSGGAPISAETQLFMSACMCPLAQGYGMTETCGVIAVQDIIEAGKPGSVGAPGSCVEVRLVASGSYNPNPERGNAQQGEIWVRGGNIMKGYYKAPELTKETITSDGWLQTGDIGEWTDSGCVKIIDRKKNLVKLSHGEYIALEKLESEYKTCTLVGNMMIHADPLESYIVALIQPNMAELKRIALELGVDSNMETDPKVHRAVLLKLAETATRAGLAGAEVLKTFTIVAEEWTSENGLLTAAQKLQRKNVLQAYEKEISRMYNRK